MCEWIKIKDQQPEQGDRCLVVVKGKIPDMVCVWGGMEFKWADAYYCAQSVYGYCPSERITHWMRLPEMPETREG